MLKVVNRNKIKIVHACHALYEFYKSIINVVALFISDWINLSTHILYSIVGWENNDNKYFNSILFRMAFA